MLFTISDKELKFQQRGNKLIKFLLHLSDSTGIGWFNNLPNPSFKFNRCKIDIYGHILIHGKQRSRDVEIAIKPEKGNEKQWETERDELVEKINKTLLTE